MVGYGRGCSRGAGAVEALVREERFFGHFAAELGDDRLGRPLAHARQAAELDRVAAFDPAGDGRDAEDERFGGRRGTDVRDGDELLEELAFALPLKANEAGD